MRTTFGPDDEDAFLGRARRSRRVVRGRLRGPRRRAGHVRGPDDAPEIRFLDAALRAEHPQTSEILHAIGQYHPSKAVAKAARKTAFKRQAIHPS